jgi:anthranilate phosphoribosyltransferase
LFILAALLLAQNGLSVAMHGTEGHTAGRLYTEETLASLGIPAAVSLADAARTLDQRNFAYVPLELLHPRLPEIMAFKQFLGLRSPLHSVLRHINPFDAKLTMISVFHPNYRPVHRDAAGLMGMQDVACFKGDGGEVERRPEKPCLVEGVRAGLPYAEEWPALMSPSDADVPMEPQFLGELWRGNQSHAVAETVVAATAALLLRLTGRAASVTDADEQARQLWAGRRRDALAA